MAYRSPRGDVRSVWIGDVRPELDGGRFPVKREVGDTLEVTADILQEGHGGLAAVLRYRTVKDTAWHEAPMEPLGNDRWAGRFPLEENTRYVYTLEAWPDAYRTWAEDLRKRLGAGMDVASELLEGAALLRGALARVVGADRRRLEARLAEFEATSDADRRARLLLNEEVAEILDTYPDRGAATRYDRELEVVVDRPLARFAAWYELFPRSQGRVPGRHGTFRDCIERLPDIAAMGFDVVYLPPIHPIGRSFRKGRNNALEAGPDDPGLPVGHRQRARRPQGDRARPGHAGGLPRLPPRRPGPRARGRARLRAPVLAGPSLGDGASRVVPPPAGRDDQVRREPAEEVPGHLPPQLLRPRARGALGGGEGHPPLLDRAGRADLPRGQPPHQADPVLGVGHRGGPGRPSRRDLPRRGLHAAAGDAGAREGRLHPVVHVLHVAELQAGADRLPDRADPGGDGGVLPRELLREHAGHPPAHPAAGRAAGLPDAPRAGGDALVPLRHLQRLRALRERRHSRAPRSTWTRRSTRSRSATGTRPATSARTSRGSTASAGRTGRSTSTGTSSSTRATTSTSSATGSAARTARTPSSWR